MTSTTIVAIFAMFIVSFLIDITILKDISIVLLFGLVMDLMNTWLLNAGILRWYIERKESKRKRYIKQKQGKGGKKRAKSS